MSSQKQRDRWMEPERVMEEDEKTEFACKGQKKVKRERKEGDIYERGVFEKDKD